MIIETNLTPRQHVGVAFRASLRTSGFYLVAGLVGVAMAASIRSDWWPFVVLFVALLVVSFGFSWVLRLISGQRYPARLRNNYMPARYDFSESEVIVDTPVSKQILKWDAFIECKKVGNYYLLYVSSTSFFPIPKSNITEADLASFQSMLGRNIKVLSTRSVSQPPSAKL